MLSRALIIMLLSLSCFSISAQNAWIFTTSEDLLNNNPLPANLSIATYTNGSSERMGAVLYTFESKDDKLNREIKHLHFAITFGDSLYINCEPFTDESYYANVIMNNRKYMYFISLPSKRNYVNRKDNAVNATIVTAAGITFGVVGSIVAYAAVGGFDKKEKYPGLGLGRSYLYNLTTKTVDEITPNFLTDILTISPELQKMYINTGSPHNNEVYYYYMNRLFNMQ